LEDVVQERTMLRFLLLAMLVGIICARSFAQETQKGAGQADPCASANTQVEMNQCSEAEYKKADAHLDAVYNNLSRMLRESADDAKKRNDETLTKQAEMAARKLRAAQNAWTEYRVLHCDAVRQQYEGGSIAPLEWATCMMDAANHRIAELKSGYEIGDRKLE
jgi:uncharacterized protein YecT (DUF1311 family)